MTSYLRLVLAAFLLAPLNAHAAPDLTIACTVYGFRAGFAEHLLVGEVLDYRVVEIPPDRLSGMAGGDPEGADFGLMMFRSDGDVRSSRTGQSGELLILVPPDAGQMLSRAPRFEPGERLILGLWKAKPNDLVSELTGNAVPDLELSNTFCGQLVLEPSETNVALVQVDHKEEADDQRDEERCYVKVRTGTDTVTREVRCR